MTSVKTSTILREAKLYLRTTLECTYICNAVYLTKYSTALNNDVQRVQAIVMNALREEFHAPGADTLLGAMRYSGVPNLPRSVSSPDWIPIRNAWLDKLIAELEAQGD